MLFHKGEKMAKGKSEAIALIRNKPTSQVLQ